MAGKYHRTYLRESVQDAFLKMQGATGRPSNDYIATAVREKLEAEGYLKPMQKLKTGAELGAEREAREAGVTTDMEQEQGVAEAAVAGRRRRRRAQ